MTLVALFAVTLSSLAQLTTGDPAALGGVSGELACITCWPWSE